MIVAIKKKDTEIHFCGAFPDIENAKKGINATQQEKIAVSSKGNAEYDLDADLSRISNNFVSRISAVQVYGYASVGMDNAVGRGLATGIIDRLLTKYGKLVNSEDHNCKEDVFYEVPDTAAIHFEQILKDINEHKAQNSRQLEFLLVIAASEFEVMLQKLMRALFQKHPNAIDLSKKTMNLEQILKYDSIDSIRDEVLERDIKDILMDSILNSITNISEKFKFKFEMSETDKSELNKIFEIRNIIVHNDGYVNINYNKNTNESLIIGERISFDSKYFINACEKLIYLGVSLVQIVWRKISKAAAKADSALVWATYELNTRTIFNATSMIGSYWAKPESTFSSTQSKHFITLNHAAALYHLDKKREAKDYLSKFDWSSSELGVSLARYALEENKNECTSILNRYGSSLEMSIYHFSRWPVFHFLRTDPELKILIESIFGSIVLEAAAENIFAVMAQLTNNSPVLKIAVNPILASEGITGITRT